MRRRHVSKRSLFFALCVPIAPLLGADPASAAVHRMFVTSESGTGDLSTWLAAGGETGLAAGDTICQTLAGDAGLLNAASFRAWLSTSATDAYCHIAGFDGQRSTNCGQSSLPDAGPWLRTDGKPFAHRLQRLTSSERIIFNPAMRDETGALVPPTVVWTGSFESGALDGGYTCGEWTDASSAGEIGYTPLGSIGWNYSLPFGCTVGGRLLCFEPGEGDPLPPFGTAGAIVFVTSESGTGDLSSWPSAGGKTGREAGDHVCQTLAAAAGYANPSGFAAWLSVAGSPALDRLSIDGPWRRAGGVRVAGSRAGLLAPDRYSNALLSDIEVDDLEVHDAGGVFTGTGTDGQPTGLDCAGWTSGSAADNGTHGLRNSASGSWTDNSTRACDQLLRLYCFYGFTRVFGDDFESGATVSWNATQP